MKGQTPLRYVRSAAHNAAFHHETQKPSISLVPNTEEQIKTGQIAEIKHVQNVT